MKKKVKSYNLTRRMLNSQAQHATHLGPAKFAVASLRFLTAMLFVFSFVFAFALTGCAYHAGFGDRQIPGGYKTLAVPMFKNATHEAGIEVYFTNAFIREVERARIGSVVEKANAQVTVEGTIDDVKYLVVEQKQGEDLNLPAKTVLNSQYRIVVTSTMRLRRNSDQKVLWEGQFVKEQNYRTPRLGGSSPSDPTGAALTGANAVYNHSARYQNIQQIASDMMAEAHDRLTENF